MQTTRVPDAGVRRTRGSRSASARGPGETKMTEGVRTGRRPFCPGRTCRRTGIPSTFRLPPCRGDRRRRPASRRNGCEAWKTAFTAGWRPWNEPTRSFGRRGSHRHPLKSGRARSARIELRRGSQAKNDGRAGRPQGPRATRSKDSPPAVSSTRAGRLVVPKAASDGHAGFDDETPPRATLRSFNDSFGTAGRSP